MPNYLSKGPVSSNFEQTYVSQFVPLPLAQFARANEKNQAVQDTQVAQASQTSDALWKISPVDANDKQYTDALRNGFDETAKSLSNTDLTQKENQDKVRGLIKNTTRDPTLNGIIAVSSARAQYEQNMSDMKKNNTYKEYNDIAGMSFQEYSANGGYKSGIRPTSDIYKYEDSEPTRKQYFDDMQKLGSETVHRVDDQWYKNGEDGISEARIGKQAHAAIYSYMGTTAAAQDGREYDLMRRQSDPKNLTKDGQLKDVNGNAMSRNKYILDKFITTGMERAGISTTTGRAQAKTDAAKQKREEANLGTFASEGQPTSLGGGYDFTDGFEANGEFKGSGKGYLQTIKEGSWTPEGIVRSITMAANDNSLNPANAKDKQAELVTLAARLNGMKPVDYYAKHAGTDVKQFTLFNTLPKKKQEAYQAQIFNEFGSGVFDNMTAIDPVTGDKGKFTELLRKALKNNPVLDSKGKPLSLDDTPTNAQIVSMVKSGSIGLKGENKPNRYSPKSLMVGVGNKEIMLDRTNNGKLTRYLLSTGQLTQREVAEGNVEAIKSAPRIEEEGGKKYIHYWHEKPRQFYNSKTKKTETIAPGVATEELTPELMKTIYK